jgi:hypothetical protein
MHKFFSNFIIIADELLSTLPLGIYSNFILASALCEAEKAAAEKFGLDREFLSVLDTYYAAVRKRRIMESKKESGITKTPEALGNG